jgi:signal transduction histidine kinase
MPEITDQQVARVLVVDDNDGTRYAVTRILASAGFDVLEAATGLGGLELAGSALPDLIVLDIKLPDLSGFEVCRQLRGAAVTRHIPILHISASFVRSEDMVRGLEGGADGYLVQPVDRPVLVATVNSLLRARRAEQEVEKARAAAEAASAAKDRFLAVLSHELRTPLTPVLMAACAMEADAEFPDQYRDDIRMIRRNIELETALIGDLLDLTRVGQGKIELELQPVDICQLLHRTIEICLPEVQEKHIRTDLRIEAGKLHVLGDPNRLQQVFWNVLKNAVKFTPEGGSITIQCLNDAGGERVIVRVSDTGVGIEAAVLGRIFEAFNQADGAGQNYGGLGLGLAISRNLVELHGGCITAHSEGAGKGSTFTIELDAVAAPAPSAESVPALSGLDATGDLDILLVEDHADSARMLSRLLQTLGHRVRTASTVGEALRAANGGRFDLLISDIGLPDGSGLDIMLKLSEAGPMPGIALSGYGSGDDIQRSVKAGFKVHLTKPVAVDALADAIREIMLD